MYFYNQDNSFIIKRSGYERKGHGLRAESGQKYLSTLMPKSGVKVGIVTVQECHSCEKEVCEVY